jgi:predicted Zn finger-like uncharacterized protein
MALATQCPYCHTCFRVANDQLKLHAGIVRCGSCQQTFNGIAQLISPEQTQAFLNKQSTQPKEEKSTTQSVELTQPTVTPEAAKEVYKSDIVSNGVVSPSITPPSESRSESQPESRYDTDTKSDSTMILAQSNLTSKINNEDSPHQNLYLENESLIKNDNHNSVGNFDDNLDANIDKTSIEIDQAEEKVTTHSTFNQIETSTPQVWQTRTPLKNEVPTNISSESPNAKANIHAQAIAIDSDTDKQETQTTPNARPSPMSAFDLDFEFDEPVTESTKETANTNDLDFEIDLETHTSPSKTSMFNEEVDLNIGEHTHTLHETGQQRKDPDYDDEIKTNSSLEEQDIALNNQSTSNKNEKQEPNFDSKDNFINKEAASIHTNEISLDHKKANEDVLLEEPLKKLILSSAEVEEEKPSFVLQAERLEKRKRWRLLSYIVCLILLISALAQATYFFRNEIVAHYPLTKPHLQKACVILKCKLEMPAQKEVFIFLADELITLSPEKNLFQLAIQIQNNSSTIQQWPHLLLTLNDSQGKPVLKRSFAPKEYLSDIKELSLGFSARTDVSIKLHFELKTIKASNYRVEVIYP